MAENRIICTKNNIDYISIRMAMATGARTVEELVEMAGICAECESCKAEIDGILSSVCGCKKVSLADVVNAVRNGADTVDKVGEITGAGTGEDCGKCKVLIQNIIEVGR